MAAATSTSSAPFTAIVPSKSSAKTRGFTLQTWSARPSTASAASRSASARVGWAWQVRAMSSLLAPNSIAATASAMRSPARGPAGFKPEPCSQRPASHGDQDAIAVEGLRVYALDDAALALYTRAGHPATQAELEALPLEEALRLRRDLRVHAGEDAVQILEDGDPCTEPPPNRSQLQPDVAGADDRKVSRHVGVAQGLRARADSVAVERNAGQLGRRAPRGDEDPACLKANRSPSVLDDHLALACDPPVPGVARNLVLAEESVDPPREGADRLVFAP